MTDDNIVPLIIIERRVTITYLSHEVSTNFSKLMAEEDTCISLEPPEGREELINVSEVIPLYKPWLVKQIYKMWVRMSDSCYWSKTEIFVKDSLYCWLIDAESNMHLNGALAVANIANFLLSQVVNVGEDCWKVILSHVLEGELPKLFVFVRVKVSMCSWMFISSAISQPHIIALICKHEARCLILIIDQPGVRTVQQTMLQNYWL